MCYSPQVTAGAFKCVFSVNFVYCRTHTVILKMVHCHWRIQGGAWPPRRVGKHLECTRRRHFQTQNRKLFWGGGNTPIGEGDTPAQTPSPRRLRRLDNRACGAWPLGASILAPSALDHVPRLQILDPPLMMGKFYVSNCVFDRY